MFVPENSFVVDLDVGCSCRWQGVTVSVGRNEMFADKLVLVEGSQVCRVSLLDSRCSSNIIVKVVLPDASGSRSNFKVGGVKWCQLCVARRCYSTERVAIAILGPQCEVARDRTRRDSL